jgi:hypothetical protein
LVEAQRQAELIRILIEEELPRAVRSCVEIHRLMATVTGAFHMSEVAYEPQCHQFVARPCGCLRIRWISPPFG